MTSEYVLSFSADRLAANRTAAVAAATAPHPIWATARLGTMRNAGQQAAIDVLTWEQVVALRAMLPAARGPGHLWAGDWGADRIRRVVSPALANATVFRSFEEWVAWLEGVEEIARGVEASA